MSSPSTRTASESTSDSDDSFYSFCEAPPRRPLRPAPRAQPSGSGMAQSARAGPVIHSLKVTIRNNEYINCSGIISLVEALGVAIEKNNRISTLKKSIQKCKRRVKIMLSHPGARKSKAYASGKIILHELSAAVVAAIEYKKRKLLKHVARATSLAYKLDAHEVAWE